MDAVPESEQLFLQEEYRGGELDFDKIFERKRQTREDFRNGKVHPFCQKCWEYQEKDYDDEEYFSHFTFAHIIKCNSRCTYCFIGNDEHLYNQKQEYQMLPIIKEMIDKNILRYNGSLRYMGGEPTLMSDFEEITNLFVNNNVPEIYLPTSGIKFSPAMENACNKVPFCQIFISIDSGCPETYKKIKNIDAYNIVLNSLKRYAAPEINKENVISKYIVVPFVNDNIEEIEKWILASKSINMLVLSIDMEFSVVHDITKEKYFKYLLQLTDYAEKLTYQNGMGMHKNVPYVSILRQWGKENEQKLLDDIPEGKVEINLSERSFDDVKLILQTIIDRNSIWNKPEIELTANVEITDVYDFDKIVHLCCLYGYEISFKTKKREFSKIVQQAILVHHAVVNFI